MSVYTSDEQKTSVLANADGDLVAVLCPRFAPAFGGQPTVTLRLAPRREPIQTSVPLSISEARQLGAALLQMVAYTESEEFAAYGNGTAD